MCKSRTVKLAGVVVAMLLLWILLRRFVNSCTWRGFTRLGNNKCYKLLERHLDWEDGVTECGYLGASLVSLETAEEYEVVTTWLNQQQMGPFYGIWLGAKRDSGEFRWVSNNEPLTIPKDGTFAGRDSRTLCNCVWTHKHLKWKWDCYTCESRLYPLCETE